MSRLLLAGMLVSSAAAQTSVEPLPSEQIRLNQVGFYPDGPKRAAVVDAAEGPFSVVSAETGEIAFTGTLGAERNWQWSGENVRLADFSSLTNEGFYYLDVPGVGTSYPFVIAPNAHEEVTRGSLKALYYQRVSTALESEHAGAWARLLGHPDNQVLVHPSAASPDRPAFAVISASGGWYDAGDYNKYIVPASFTSYLMLAGLEHYPEYFAALETDIPESGNGVPDVLDEAIWNLRFMMRMQDPYDGGVYHKLSTENFQAFVLPHVPTASRYVVQKSTAATLDFAAAAAQASRILRQYESVYPGLADSALTAALNAWNWARANPDVAYNQNTMNQVFEPDINTGEYGDGNRSDERAFAAIELYMTTGQDSFHQAVPVFVNNDVPGWGGVNMLAYMTLARLDAPTAAGEALKAEAEQRLISVADLYRTSYQTSAMGTAIGRNAGNFYWGSNGGAASIGVVLIQAYEITRDESYLDAAISTLDYLLGLNGTGYSYLTAYGGKPPVDPHHRQSGSDQLPAPVPGLLAGGPNPGQQDGCTYSSNLPASSYVDAECSYASNEVTTYWNVPLTYLAGAAEAIAGNEPVASAPPHLLSPLPRTTSVPIYGALSWTGTAPFEAYELEVAASLDFANPVVRETLDVDRSLVMLDPGRTYYWRVRGIVNGIAGRWSTVGVFRVPPAGPVRAFDEQAGMVVMEAESRAGFVAQPTGEWVFWRPVAGDVGQSAYASPNTGKQFGDDFRVTSPMLYYNVRLNTPGTWYAWVRMQGATADDDAVHLGVNGQPVTAGDPVEAGEPHSEWKWVGQRASGERITIDVSDPGVHSINLWMAEDGTLVDRLLLTTDASFVPEGEGPEESANTVGTGVQPELPAPTLSLRAIYPNPITSDATVAYSTSATTHVRLEVFDVIGRRVAVLVDDVLPAGEHAHILRAPKFAAGSYFLRLTAGGETAMRQIAVVR